MSNKDLFKQAIAEAKTIREAAITNAKEALEESLTPHLKEMLAQKLQEMEDAEDVEETVNEEDMMNDPEGETAHGNVAEAEEEEAEEVEGEEAEEEGEEGEEAEEEELDLENMSVEEFKDLVRDIVAQEVGHEESEEELPGEEAPEGGEDMVGMDSEEEIDINELLAELAEMDGEDDKMEEYSSGKVDPMSMFSGKETGRELDVQLVNAIKAAAKKAGTSVQDFMKKHILAQPGEKSAPRETSWNESAELEEYSSGKVDPMSMFSGKETGKELDVQLANAVKSAAKKVGMSVQDFMKKHILAQPGEKSAPRETSWNESEELEEALATVAELRTQLQEVNLLNAKLLYVNKVFKANNLTESQKVNVVAAFDKAETVKEVKLVFETVSKNVVTKPVAIKEHKSFASSAVGTAATAGKKEIISEVSEQVARWQKLAGIIK
jgi:hypothetical protein